MKGNDMNDDLVKRMRGLRCLHEEAELLWEAADRIEELEAKLAALSDAAQPIMEAADECDECGYDGFNQAPVTADDCRALRAALTK